MDVRYRIEGKLRVNLGILMAPATGRVTFSAMRKGMRMGSVLGNASSFVRAHNESEGRLADAAALDL
jgi:hypothetical protein